MNFIQMMEATQDELENIKIHMIKKSKNEGF